MIQLILYYTMEAIITWARAEVNVCFVLTKINFVDI